MKEAQGQDAQGQGHGVGQGLQGMINGQIIRNLHLFAEAGTDHALVPDHIHALVLDQDLGTEVPDAQGLNLDHTQNQDLVHGQGRGQDPADLDPVHGQGQILVQPPDPDQEEEGNYNFFCS